MKRYGFGAAVLALFCGAVLLTGAGRGTAEGGDFRVGKNMDIFFNLFRDVNTLYVDSVNPDELLEAAAAAMLDRLDPYTEFLPESTMADFEIATTGKYGGVGALIRKPGDDRYAEVAEVYRGFPADKAGLKTGDRILAVDGRDTKALPIEQVSDLMKGAPGSKVKMKVEDLRTGTAREAVLTRERIVISGVVYYGMLDGGVGYVALNNFTEGCSDDVHHALLELRKQGPLKGLVLDLRGNPGGIFDEAVDIVSLFVPKGTEAVSMKARTRPEPEVYRTGREPFDTELPLAVLVNSASASSSEIVAGALQDLDRAVVMGQRSFGKGLVQTPRPAGYGTYLKLTTAKYYIPSGRCIQALDYSHRNEDGSVGTIPDSLISEFRTRNGRRVYDGGGIMPDVRIAPSYMSKFAAVLNARGYVDDFANLYYKQHEAVPDIHGFALSEADYAAFTEFMEDKDMEYVSGTKAALERLRQAAERERYDESIAEEVRAIEKKIGGDKEQDLKTYEDELKEYLESAIILRYHYNRGSIERMVGRDTVVEKARSLVVSPEYREILDKRDTERK